MDWYYFGMVNGVRGLNAVALITACYDLYTNPTSKLGMDAFTHFTSILYSIGVVDMGLSSKSVILNAARIYNIYQEMHSCNSTLSCTALSFDILLHAMNIAMEANKHYEAEYNQINNRP